MNYICEYLCWVRLNRALRISVSGALAERASSGSWFGRCPLKTQVTWSAPLLIEGDSPQSLTTVLGPRERTPWLLHKTWRRVGSEPSAASGCKEKRSGPGWGCLLARSSLVKVSFLLKRKPGQAWTCGFLRGILLLSGGFTRKLPNISWEGRQ